MSDQSDLAVQSATRIAELIRRREVSPVEVIDATFDRLDRLDPAINAFVTVLHERARAQAAIAES